MTRLPPKYRVMSTCVYPLCRCQRITSSCPVEDNNEETGDD